MRCEKDSTNKVFSYFGQVFLQLPLLHHLFVVSVNPLMTKTFFLKTHLSSIYRFKEEIFVHNLPNVRISGSTFVLAALFGTSLFQEKNL